jgi:hypothetical protein
VQSIASTKRKQQRTEKNAVSDSGRDGDRYSYRWGDEEAVSIAVATHLALQEARNII